MKKTIQYPAAFDAEVPRHKDIKKVVAFLECEIDIPEVSNSSAPIVITVHDVDNLMDVREGTEFRVHEDRLLVDTGIRAEEFGASEIRKVEKRGSLILPMIEALKKTYGYGDGYHIYPPKAPQVLAGLIWSGGVSGELDDTWKHMVEAGKLAESRQMNADQIKLWETAVKEHASTFAIIDGTVWRETAEPCYTVSATMAPGLTTRTASFFRRLRNGLMDENQWSRYRGQGRNFSALDRERAYRYGMRAATENGLNDEANLPRIDIVTPDIPLIDFEAHEFERVSRLLVYDLADGFRKAAHGKGVDFFRLIPADVMNLFMAARDKVETMDAGNGITPDQEEAVLELVERLNATPEKSAGYLIKMKLDDVNEVFNDWLARDISVGSVMTMTGPGNGR